VTVRPYLRAFGALLWLCAFGSWLQAGVLQAPAGARGLRAEETPGETCIVDRDGGRLSCWPRVQGSITDLRETSRGWIAAGHSLGIAERRLFVVRDLGQGLEWLAAPAAEGVVRGRPELVADDTRLLGLVWLEGPVQEELEIRAAEWLGGDWGPAMTVSPRGDGAQLAPAATVLEGGAWLVLWTAVDGHDDELMWSLFGRGAWSTPVRVHEDNAMPDVMPTVVTSPQGAIAAWSWLDGRDYRVRTAFFDGRAWRLDEPYAGRGGLEPHLANVSGVFLLSFMTVEPGQWVACELDASGRLLHRAVVARQSGQRPVIDFIGNGVSFSWQGTETAREILATWDSER